MIRKLAKKSVFCYEVQLYKTTKLLFLPFMNFIFSLEIHDYQFIRIFIDLELQKIYSPVIAQSYKKKKLMSFFSF
jgi:hypothetical protein